LKPPVADSIAVGKELIECPGLPQSVKKLNAYREGLTPKNEFHSSILAEQKK